MLSSPILSCNIAAGVCIPLNASRSSLNCGVPSISLSVNPMNRPYFPVGDHSRGTAPQFADLRAGKEI